MNSPTGFIDVVVQIYPWFKYYLPIVHWYGACTVR